MATMHDNVSGKGQKAVNINAIKSDIRAALINSKVNACPIAVRLAWHASGTFDKSDNSGGSNGARMRFSPEKDDGANAGLSIVRDLLLPVHEKYPEVSQADLWSMAGAFAVEFLGGKAASCPLGREDMPSGETSPGHGRLPDASQGAEHLREVFGKRMGFSDAEIVALSGAHTLGRCHVTRSGYDGPWTSLPLSFDNEYFTNLIELEWTERKWDGPEMFVATRNGAKVYMLPTDIALIRDEKFRPTVELYARDEKKFFEDFADAFSKLMCNGCPVAHPAAKSEKELANTHFREMAMHGSLVGAKDLESSADVHAVEPTSGRSALHYAAFWGHVLMTKYLVNDLKLNVNVQDRTGDSPLHDASRFGHTEVVKALLDAGADQKLLNKDGCTANDLALKHGYEQICTMIGQARL